MADLFERNPLPWRGSGAKHYRTWATGSINDANGLMIADHIRQDAADRVVAAVNAMGTLPTAAIPADVAAVVGERDRYRQALEWYARRAGYPEIARAALSPTTQEARP